MMQYVEGGTGMSLAKQQVIDLLSDLPEDVDIDEIIYRLYIRQKLELAEKDVHDGSLVSHAEVVRESRNIIMEVNHGPYNCE
jgi:hypothetical protein